MFLDMRSPLQAIKAGNVESNLYCKNFSLVSYTTNLYHDIIKHEAFTTVQVFLFFFCICAVDVHFNGSQSSKSSLSCNFLCKSPFQFPAFPFPVFCFSEAVAPKGIHEKLYMASRRNRMVLALEVSQLVSYTQ